MLNPWPRRGVAVPKWYIKDRLHYKNKMNKKYVTMYTRFGLEWQCWHLHSFMVSSLFYFFWIYIAALALPVRFITVTTYRLNSDLWPSTATFLLQDSEFSWLISVGRIVKLFLECWQTGNGLVTGRQKSC